MITSFLTSPPGRKLVALARGQDARSLAHLAGFSEWASCNTFTMIVPTREPYYELHVLDKDSTGPALIVPADSDDIMVRVRDVALCFDRDTPEKEYQVSRFRDALFKVAIREMEALYEIA